MNLLFILATSALIISVHCDYASGGGGGGSGYSMQHQPLLQPTLEDMPLPPQPQEEDHTQLKRGVARAYADSAAPPAEPAPAPEAAPAPESAPARAPEAAPAPEQASAPEAAPASEPAPAPAPDAAPAAPAADAGGYAAAAPAGGGSYPSNKMMRFNRLVVA
ncbi:unnamed protein product [Caenorhabditis nigoni]